MLCVNLAVCHVQVTAKGKPDEMFCWMFDVHLSLSKLLGRLCGANLAAVTSMFSSLMLISVTSY